MRRVHASESSGSVNFPTRFWLSRRLCEASKSSIILRERNALHVDGCSGQVRDDSDSDLGEWISQGLVDIRPVFSRSPEDSNGCKYLQHRVWNDSADNVEAYSSGVAFLTCGSANVAKEIKATLVNIIKTGDNVSLAAATEKFEKITKGRYVIDIFD
ncbi:hypothetical protein C8R44DRAFT_879410 [Mycena epipterygia]|nr:hypothetical protein C8R44DRAFT_879410 [Mycena epipterygia]